MWSTFSLYHVFKYIGELAAEYFQTSGKRRRHVPNLKCITVRLVVESVYTTSALPTNFQVGIPHGKIARLRVPPRHSHTSLLVYSLFLWLKAKRTYGCNRIGNNLLFVHPSDPTHNTNETGLDTIWVGLNNETLNQQKPLKKLGEKYFLTNPLTSSNTTSTLCQATLLWLTARQCPCVRCWNPGNMWHKDIARGERQAVKRRGPCFLLFE